MPVLSEEVQIPVRPEHASEEDTQDPGGTHTDRYGIPDLTKIRCFSLSQANQCYGIDLKIRSVIRAESLVNRS